MSKGPDWKQAMLNEAEASGNEAWARETQRAVLFNPWEINRRQILPFFGITVVAAIVTQALGYQETYRWTPELCGSPTETCGLSLGALAVSLALFYALVGVAFHRWDMRSLLLIIFVIIVQQRVQTLDVIVTTMTDWQGFGFVLLTVVLPTALGYRAAYELGLRRARSAMGEKA